MASSFKRGVRLLMGLGLLLAVFQACGGLNSGTVNVVADNGNTQANGGTPSGGSMGAAGESSVTPVGGAGSECMTGDACGDALQGAICVEGACSPCAGVKDDPKCVRAYGKGNLCIDGGCIKADCHADTDCTAGACIGHHCTPCAADGDCSTPSTVCNVSTGACVTNASCGNVAAGADCPVNPNDKCCTAKGVCAAAQCCGTAPCKTTLTAAGNDGACQNGQCVKAGCSAPPPSARFVDFGGVAGGSGSKDCPFNTLGAAMQDLAVAGGQVIVKSGSVATVDVTFSVGAGIIITGADGTFTPCTKDSCSDSSKWPLINTGNRRALNIVTPGNRTVHFMRLVGVDAAQKDTATTSAIYVASGSVSVDHVDVSGYQYGVFSDTASSVKVNDGARFHGNRTGIYVSDGNGAAGGNIAVTATAELISFDHNGIGVQCHGNGVLKISGPPTGPKLTSLISANDNDGSGLYLSVLGTQASIDGIECANNGQDPTSGQQDGATVYAHSVVKIRNSYFHDNQANGIHIPANGATSADALTKIDLGTNQTTGAGRNTFIANTLAAICIGTTTADAADLDTLAAEGNIFRTSGGDCTKAGGTFLRALTCTGGVDISADCKAVADLASCTVGNTCQ